MFRLSIVSLVVIMLLALGGLGLTGVAMQNGGLSFALGLPQVGTPWVIQVPPAESGLAAPNTQAGGYPLGVDARSAVRRTGPAVVTVVNNLRTGNQRGGFGAPTASGSGVIVDSRGYIVTNNHVVENQSSLEVIFSDGTKAPARLVGADSFSDLAVIKVDGNVPSVATFGDSASLELGQPVVAIGSALGSFQNTVTVGVVSGLNRDLGDPGSPALRNLIQTDAAINHGNSGGPLLDLEGRIIGINVAVVRGAGFTGDVAEGLGFAIPGNTAREVVNQLISNGSVTRPYLGVSYQEITPQTAAYFDLPRDKGVLIMEVVPGGPADQAGLKPGDIITKFNGNELDDASTMLDMLLKQKVGDRVTLTVLPDGETAEREITITLSVRPQDQ